MRRILLVVRWPVGGIRTFLRYHFDNFDSEKYALDIVAPSYPETQALLEDLQRFAPRYFPCSGGRSRWGMAGEIRSRLSNTHYDLMYSHGFTAGICAAIADPLRRTKHMMTVHDVLLDKQMRGLTGRLKRHVMECTFRRMDLLHLVSHDAYDNLLEFMPGLKSVEKRIVAIPNGVDVERFMIHEKRDLRSELGLEKNTFLIGYFGRFMSQKGFVHLIEAVDILSRERDLAPFVVVCFGYGGYVREDTRRLTERGLGRYFRFLPFEANIARSLRGVDVVAMPSLWEACGLLAMETMVAGVPLIGSDCIGLREVMRATPHSTAPKANSKALAEALAREMRVPTRDIAEEFRKDAAARFDVRERAKELERKINGVIGDHLA